MLRNPHRSLRNKCDAHTRDAAPTRAASAAPTHPCAFLPMPSNPRKHRKRAIYDSLTRRCAEQVSDHVLETAEQPQNCCRMQSWRHTWYVTIGASQPLRMIPRPETREARGMQLCLWWLHAPHAPYCMLCCTVTVAVLGGLVCAQSRSAFARDGSSERIHISRRRW